MVYMALNFLDLIIGDRLLKDNMCSNLIDLAQKKHNINTINSILNIILL